MTISITQFWKDVAEEEASKNIQESCEDEARNMILQNQPKRSQ